MRHVTHAGNNKLFKFITKTTNLFKMQSNNVFRLIAPDKKTTHFACKNAVTLNISLINVVIL